MPLYEYRCAECGAVTTVFTRAISVPVEPVCSRCGGARLTRMLSSFTHHRSLNAIHGETGPPVADASLDAYQDPRNVGRYVEESFHGMGVEMPKEAREAIDAAREGVVPKELDL